MKNLFKTITVVAALLISSYTASASHVAGSDLTYRCLGGDTFEFTLNVFRDCAGIGYGNTTVPLVATSTCGGSLNITLTKYTGPLVNSGGDTLTVNGRGGYEVSQLCAAALLTSRCKPGGSSYPGMEQYVFRGTAVVRPRCNTWTFSRNIVCCRNTNNNMTSSASAAVATLNSITDSCNSSPRFAAQPIPYVCAGRTIVYNFGVTEDDGDSLVFALDCGFTTLNNVNVFRSPHSCTSPIPGITINSANGKVVFTPTVTGNWVLVVKVCEYDRATGALKACVYRDILVVVQVCNNTPPPPNRLPGYVGPTPGTIYNFSGTGQQIDSNSIEVCIGENFTFDVFFYDTDSIDSLSLKSNIQGILPGATFTWTHPPSGRTDSAIATISWTATPTAGYFYPFFIEACDNACPIPALFYATFDITIVESTYAGPDLTICQTSQTANFGAVGGSQFTWTAIPGGSGITVPTNFSCDTCRNVVASPNITTTYVVTSNLSGTCKNKDTITVRVVPDYTLTVTPDDTICNIDTVPLSALTSDPSQNYTYKWSQKKFLDFDTVPNPNIRGLNLTRTFSVTVSSDSGCVKEQDIKITVADPFPPNIRALASDTLICLDDTVDFNVSLGTIPVNNCGLAQYPCQGFPTNVQVVNGTTRSSASGLPSTPNPYSNVYTSVHQQYLYRAADLRAAGMTAGRISAMDFFVVSYAGNPFFNNYTVKMSCTNIKQLTSNWESNLIEVYSSKTHTVTTGWNTHTFDNAYNWDGISNLIVDVCYDNSSSSPIRSQNAVINYQGTSYAATSSGVNFSQNACSGQAQYFTSPYNALPNTRFAICKGVDPGGYNFSWGSSPGSNSGFFTSTNISNPSAAVNLTTDPTYFLYISDTLGVCYDTVALDINVVSRYKVKPVPALPVCVKDGFQILKSPTPFNILPRPGGGYWTGPGIVNDSLGFFDPASAGKGTHWVKYEVKGDACAAIDSTQYNVVGLPDVLFSEGPYCENDSTNQLDTNSIHLRAFFSSTIPGVVDTNTNNFDATSPNINAPDSVPVTYHAFNGCWHDTTIYVQVVRQFDATIKKFGPYCSNDLDVNVFAADSGGIWAGPGIVDPKGIFSPTTAGPGVHTIRVDSFAFCGNSGTKDITVVQIPEPEILDPGPFCNDGSNKWSQPAEIFASSFNPGGRWGAPTTPPWMPFTTQALFVPSAVVANGYGAYPLTYTEFDTIAPGKVCAGTDTIDVVFATSPEAPEATGPFEFCSGVIVDNIFASATGNNVLYWFDNEDSTDIAASIATGDLLSLGQVTEKGAYYIRNVDTAGCVSAATTIQYFVSENPIADFDVDPFNQEDLQLPVEQSWINKSDDASGNVNINKWRWMLYKYGYGEDVNDTLDDVLPVIDLPADTGTANMLYTTEDAVHNFSADEADTWGRHIVALYVETDKGCWDTSWVTFYIDPIIDFQIPNVFTPPAKGGVGDGINDTFLETDKIQGISELEGWIYNRWGRKVHELSLGSPVWDGGDQEDGVYFYVIRIKTLGAGEEEQEFKGNVTLIRQSK